MGIACEQNHCLEQFASREQLDLHLAFKHVPYEAILFTCPTCNDGQPFKSAAELLKHTAEEHREAGAISSMAEVLGATSGPDAAADAGKPPQDKENAPPGKKKRFQCNRCAYGTNHSAWLLQKHVIYEHLVDQLGHAKPHDPGLAVPQVRSMRHLKQENGMSAMDDFAAEVDEAAYGLDGSQMGGSEMGGSEVTGYSDAQMLGDDELQNYGTEGDVSYPEAFPDTDPSTSVATPAAPPTKRTKMAPGSAPVGSVKKCPHCAFSTSKPGHMRNHMLYAHSVGAAAAGDSTMAAIAPRAKWFNCDTCGHKERTKRELDRHKLQHAPGPAQDKLDILDSCGLLSAQLYECSMCIFCTSKKSTLRRHIASKHVPVEKTRWHHCDLCGTYKAKRKDNLKQHQVRCIFRPKE